MKQAQGFSLIEMAFVLVIITLLLGGLLVPFTTQVEQRRITETNKALEEIKEALVGYALSHSATVATNGTLQPYLPCPDTDGDGLEEARNGAGDCPDNNGNLPWATLGISPADAWGNRFHYAATTTFTNSINGFGLTITGSFRVCDRAPGAISAACPGATMASNIPAIVLSYGKNGYGARNSGGTVNQAPASLDEIENTGAGPNAAMYISRTITPAGTPAGEFDDLVTWLSPNILFNRMVAAGRLP